MSSGATNVGFVPIFNSPPGWPTPPAGWTPPQGWQPDPSWPPAPADHVWWTADHPAPQLVMAGGQAGPQHPGPTGPGAHPAAYAALHELVPAPATAPHAEQGGPYAHVPAGVPAQRPAPAVPTSRFGTPVAPADVSTATAQHGAPSFDLVAHYTDEQRRAGRKAILVGVVMLLVGLGVTIGGYVSADVGGSYVVLWGPVVVGLVSIVRGVVQMARAGEAALRRVLNPR
ncbi:hypothetical protein ICW40_03785 [Actinotalea ferrariae]|uniref:hypothetical protein n=1 Tax=Actinotalea ferrariae TaxID=1386098 RepID=UPI001C8C74C3|nr:hypothetical protein [Actinotalea ferrariae]MBX9243927.1 hypothetical protein [Actinotalea ferrariae]